VAALVASLLVILASVGDTMAQADQPDVYATVGNAPAGQTMAPGFVGLSLEYKAVRAYTGSNPNAINPVLVRLLRQLAPGQAPVLRIGGDSTDATWWPVRGVIPPGGVSYSLTPGWIRTTRALTDTVGAHLIMGINLAAGRPALAAAEGRAILRGLGRSQIDAFEIGNEPDIYSVFPWYRDRNKAVWFSRPHFYSLGSLTREFSRWRSVLPSVPAAGPALAELTWLSGLPRFLSSEHGLGLVTVHRYPLRGCIRDASDPSYATLPSLLNDQASTGLAQAIAPDVATAHARGLRFRVDELNSVSCSGTRGVSDTFASALWMLDTLFNLASVGVDGVNVHSFPGAAYEPFSFTQTRGFWQAFVHPEYYGMLMFGQAFPPGARLLPVTSTSGPVKIWATRSPDGSLRIVLINKDTAAAHTVQLQAPGIGRQSTLKWLQAPSAGATSGVTFGGRTFGTTTTSGLLTGPLQVDQTFSLLNSYTLNLPPASSVLLTQ
jgi:hypothetical protein